MVDPRHLVFVYGTLKTGEPNHKTMSETPGQYRLVSHGTTVEKFPLIVGTRYNLPFLLDQPGIGNQIRGELYEVCDKKLEALDELEAYPTLYDRKTVEIKLDSNGSTARAFLYLLKKWRPELVAQSSEMMDNYSTNGSHGRPYVEKYATAKDALDGSTLYQEILGAHSPVFLELARQKSVEKSEKSMGN